MSGGWRFCPQWLHLPQSMSKHFQQPGSLVSFGTDSPPSIGKWSYTGHYSHEAEEGRRLHFRTVFAEVISEEQQTEKPHPDTSYTIRVSNPGLPGRGPMCRCLTGKIILSSPFIEVSGQVTTGLLYLFFSDTQVKRGIRVRLKCL